MARVKYDIPDWLGAAPVIPESQISETLEFDVVVCGGGNAGVSVARAAAQEGASVAVLEHQPEDKYHFIGEQIGHFNSKILKKMGVKPVEDLEEVVAEFQKRSGNYTNANLVRQFVYNCGEAVDDLIDLVPEDSDILKTANVHIPWKHEKKTYPMQRSGYKTWAGCLQFRGGILDTPIVGVASFSNLTDLQKLAVADAQGLGAKWFFDTGCEVLTKDGERVTGVIGKRSDGTYTKYIARKGVALCCGDFGLNSDMCVALLDELREQGEARGQDPSTIHTFGHDGNGDPLGNHGQGHKLGCWAGGHIEDGPRAYMQSGNLGGCLGYMAMLALNCKGERFMDETVFCGQPMQINRQPLGDYVGISDSRILEYCKFSTMEHGQPDFGVEEFQRQIKEDFDKLFANRKTSPVGTIRSASITERLGNDYYVADTLEELAGLLGYEGEAKAAFLASVSRYNDMCRAGRDLDFAKEADMLWPIEVGPFVAFKGNNSMVMPGLVTLTGLEVDSHQRVIGDDGRTPIPGLFTAGNNCGGRYAIGYACPVGGNSIGMAVTLGRELGKYIAKLPA